MDFADIYEQWERGEGQKAKRAPKQGVPSDASRQADKKQPERREHPMNIWLRRGEIIDKDSEAEKQHAQEKETSVDYLRSMPPEASCDLHGMTGDEAWARLQQFIDECCRRGLRKVLIIHGKGNHSSNAPVLASLVRAFIEGDRRLGISGHPKAQGGGKGATWVLIKERR